MVPKGNHSRERIERREKGFLWIAARLELIGNTWRIFSLMALPFMLIGAFTFLLVIVL